MKIPLALINALGIAVASGDDTPPANDDRANATTIPDTTVFTVTSDDILCATFEPDEPFTTFGSAAKEDTRTIWFILLDLTFNGIDLGDPAQSTVLDTLRSRGTDLVPYPQFMPTIDIEGFDTHITIRCSAEPHTTYLLHSTASLGSNEFVNETAIHSRESREDIEVFQELDRSAPRFFDILVQTRPESSH